MLMLTVTPAAASEPSEWDTTVVSTNSISGISNDLSGVAITDTGLIYGVNNGERVVECLSSDINGNWSAQNSAALPGSPDIEGITWVGGSQFLTSWEDNNAGNTSGVTFVTMNGPNATVGASFSLAPLMELGGNNEGGAEGIAWLGGDEYLVVQEGVIPPAGGNAVPKLYSFNAATGVVTFLFDLDGADAAGIAVEPGDPNNIWVLSEADKTISKYNLTTQQKAPTEISLANMNQPEGLAFTPDGTSLVVVGEQDEIRILQRSGYAGNPAAPTGDCTVVAKTVDASSVLPNITRPAVVLVAMMLATALAVRLRRRSA